MTLDKLEIDKPAKIKRINAKGESVYRIMEMGLTPNTKVTVRKTAPLGDPIQIWIRGFEITLSKSEARLIEITS